MTKLRSLSIIIPVYNEGSNFAPLWARLTKAVPFDFHAFVVYDFDEDDTLPVARGLMDEGERRMQLVRSSGHGVVSAIMTGVEAASDGPVVVVMADLADDLDKLGSMMELYEQGFDVVAASRYMKGGRLIGGPAVKQMLSRMAGVSLFWLRGLPTHDATNAFKIYDRAMVKRFQVQSTGGFELNLELTAKAFLDGYSITEVPASWWDRTRGKSRFQLMRWLPLYLRWYFYCFQPRKAVPRKVVRRDGGGHNAER